MITKSQLNILSEFVELSIDSVVKSSLQYGNTDKNIKESDVKLHSDTVIQSVLSLHQELEYLYKMRVSSSNIYDQIVLDSQITTFLNVVNIACSHLAEMSRLTLKETHLHKPFLFKREVLHYLRSISLIYLEMVRMFDDFRTDVHIMSLVTKCEKFKN